MDNGKEYRWEREDVGQGHYYNGLLHCVLDAHKASSEAPYAVVRVEQFKPTRVVLLRIQNGEELN